jgi:hypothetical protein
MEPIIGVDPAALPVASDLVVRCPALALTG